MLDGTFVAVSITTKQVLISLYRMSLAQNWRRRGMFDDVAFVFPNAPMIPITVVCCGFDLSLGREVQCAKQRIELWYDHARVV